MVRPKGGAARRHTAAACRGLRRGREPAKQQVAWQGAGLWGLPIHPNWTAADGSHPPSDAFLRPVAGPPSRPLFTDGFRRGACFRPAAGRWWPRGHTPDSAQLPSPSMGAIGTPVSR